MVKDGNICDRVTTFQDCARDFQVCVPSTNPSEMTLNFSSSMTLNLAASDCNIFGFSFGCLVVFSCGNFLSLYFSIDPIDATNLAMPEFLNGHIHDGDFKKFDMFVPQMREYEDTQYAIDTEEVDLVEFLVWFLAN